MVSSSPLPDLPEIGIELPKSALALKALEFAKKHCTETVVNHVARAAYWAAIILKKRPELNTPGLDTELILVGCLLHDMGWAAQELLSPDKRFEVDGANIARKFIQELINSEDSCASDWDEARLQRIWYAISLHTSFCIANFAEPEVALMCMGIVADFMGPLYPNGPGATDNHITVEEYHAVMRVFPRAGFDSEGMKGIICNLCKTKPNTTYDNFASSFGRAFGVDGKGGGKEDYIKNFEASQFIVHGLPSLDYLAELDKPLK